jgi:hypothetical protein
VLKSSLSYSTTVPGSVVVGSTVETDAVLML